MRFLKIAVRLAVIAYALFVLWHYGPQPFVPVVLFFLVGLIVLYPAMLRTSLLSQFSADPEYLDLHPDQWPAEFQAEVRGLTAEFEDLGFVPLHDEIQRLKRSRAATFYHRFLVHREHRCIGMIQVIVLNRRTLRPACMVHTFYGTRLNLAGGIATTAPLADPNAQPATAPALHGYLYTTHNRAPLVVHEMILHPQALRTRMTGAAPAELVQSHLSRREAIGRQLGLQPDEGDWLQLYHAFQRRHWKALLSYLRRQNPWSQFIAARRTYKQRTEWLGDLKTPGTPA
jgi:hypothetical protein